MQRFFSKKTSKIHSGASKNHVRQVIRYFSLIWGYFSTILAPFWTPWGTQNRSKIAPRALPEPPGDLPERTPHRKNSDRSKRKRKWLDFTPRKGSWTRSGGPGDHFSHNFTLKTLIFYRTDAQKNGMIPSTFGAFFRRAARRPQQKDQSQLKTVYHTPAFPIGPLTTHTLRGGLGAAP